MELTDIRDFLGTVPSFDALSEGTLNELAGRLEVRYHRRGRPFPPEDDDSAGLYILRSGAIELRDADGGLLDRLDEGALVNLCEGNLDDGVRSGQVSEDALVYRLPCPELARLSREDPALATAVAGSERERLKNALVEARRGAPSAGVDLAAVAVGDLLARPAVTTSAATSIRAAAEQMSREKVSALLVVDDDGRLIGVLTDRDLRNRCLAAGLDPSEPVGTIQTTEPRAVEQSASALEALMTMTRDGIHHLPVVDDSRPLGLVSSGDLLRRRAGDALYLVGDIRRAADVDTLARAAHRLRELQPQMVATGADATHVTRAVTAVVEALTRRLVELAEAELGPPPVGYAWFTCGSVARDEATMGSDQDNGLILLEDPGEHQGWFEALARRVSDGLDACGFPYCPGNVMATNPDWLRTVDGWRDYFRRWTHEPDPEALMHASIFFDMRFTTGSAGAEAAVAALRAEILEWTARNTLFLAAMAGNALKHQPPLGFFRQFVLNHGGEYDHTLDIKKEGLITIVDLARVRALAAGLPTLGTRARLEALARDGHMNGGDASELIDTFNLLGNLRIRHQTDCLRAGREPNNHLDPEELSRLERQHLKDAFRVIQTHQAGLAQRYQAGRFG